MTTLPQQILDLLATSPGLTDRQIANALRGDCSPQQPINQAARALEAKKKLVRRKRIDGLTGNYPSEITAGTDIATAPAVVNHDLEALTEDEIKRALVSWLATNGWTSTVAWAKARGIDIDARRGAERWVIEVKGPGSRPPMRVNYFVGILGETLQRMSDPNASYSIALPDVPQFRRLWERLPALAKERTGVTAIFVSKSGDVSLAPSNDPTESPSSRELGP